MILIPGRVAEAPYKDSMLAGLDGNSASHIPILGGCREAAILHEVLRRSRARDQTRVRLGIREEREIRLPS